MDIQTLIGFGAAPLVIIALTAHIRSFARAVHAYLRGFMDSGPEATVWPLVADLVAVAWCVALAQGGQLQAFLQLERMHLATIVLVGIALGIISGQIRDKVTSQPAPPIEAPRLAPQVDVVGSPGVTSSSSIAGSEPGG